MAISKSQKGVEVHVAIDGTKAKEYEYNLDETHHEHPKKTMLRYIESASDANFAIVSKVSPAYKLKSALEFQIQIDNTTMPIAPLFVPKEGIYRNWIGPLMGRKRSIGMAVRGRSRSIDAHDNKRVKSDARAAKHIGEIRVTIYRKQVLEQTHERTGGNDVETNLEISEKAVKGQALSHGTAYEEAVGGRKTIKVFETKPARGGRTPAAVFIFRYRSKDALQQQHIIPRAQSPDILDSLSEEELREIARQHIFGKQHPKTENIKKEAGADNGIFRKFTNDDEILTIDITGDEEIETRIPKKRKATVDLCDDDDDEGWSLG